MLLSDSLDWDGVEAGASMSSTITRCFSAGDNVSLDFKAPQQPPHHANIWRVDSTF